MCLKLSAIGGGGGMGLAYWEFGMSGFDFSTQFSRERGFFSTGGGAQILFRKTQEFATWT